MSTFLGFEDFVISLGASIQNVQDTFEAALNSYSWQTLRRALVPIAYPTSSMTNYLNALDMTGGGSYAGVASTGSGIIGIQLTPGFTPTFMYNEWTST